MGPLLRVEAVNLVDVEASRAIRQAEVGAACTMIERVMDRFGLCPEHLAGDSAYGAAEMVGWLVEERGIEPHVAVIDKSGRRDSTFSRSDLFYDQDDDVYICPDHSDAHHHRNAGERRGHHAVPCEQSRLFSLPVES